MTHLKTRKLYPGGKQRCSLWPVGRVIFTQSRASTFTAFHKISALSQSLSNRFNRSDHVVVRVLRNINNFSHRHPALLATCTSGIRCCLADIILAQYLAEGRDLKDVNWTRVSLFTLYGALYVGFFQYGVYGKVYPFLFDGIKNTNRRMWILSQTAVDMCIHAPFVYMPSFYIVKNAVYMQQFDKEVISAALHEYFVINFKDDIKHLFIVWTPLTAILFGVMPPRYRVPWLDFCGLGWVTLLSVTRGEEHNGSVDSEEVEIHLPTDASQLNVCTVKSAQI